MQIVLENFSKLFGSVRVIEDMSLTINDGEMLALLGPSGCGKTTTLFAVCGIQRVTSGRILFGEQDVTNVPSQRRNVGVVFQSYALYPHFNVFENIAFPLRIRKEPRSDVARKVEEIAALVHIDTLLDRRPSELSGGQQQRVALARALVRKPAVLLLDEPLANLDTKLRREMRSELRRIQQETGITAILVTHDQVEAMSICDRIAIMNEGRIQQVAPPEEMYADPANEFVAGFLGNAPITFLTGTARNGHFQNNAIRLPLPSTRQPVPEGSTVKMGIRPEHVRPDAPAQIVGTVTFIEPQGRENLYDLTIDGDLTLRSIQPAGQSFKLGDQVTWGVDTDRCIVFNVDGARL